MAYCIVIMLIASLVLHRIGGSRGFDLFRLFAYMWLTIIILGIFNPYGYYEVSETFYTILFAGMLSWIAGYAAVRLFFDWREKVNGRKPIKADVRPRAAVTYEINRPVYYAFVGIMVVFLGVMVIRSIQLLGNEGTYHDLYQMANADDEGSFFSDGIIAQLYRRVMVPVVLASIPASVVIILRERKKAIGVIGLLLTVLHSVLTGSRVSVLYSALYIFLGMSVFAIHTKWKTKLVMVGAAVAMGALVMWMTNTRDYSAVEDQLQYTMDAPGSYLNLCLPLGDYWIHEVADFDAYGFGYATFRGIIVNIDFLTRQFGVRFLDKPNLEYWIAITQAVRVPIGPEAQANANAFVTWVYFFYLDFRMAGVIIGSILFGVATGLLERSARKTQGVMQAAFYLLFAQMVVKTNVRWELEALRFPLAFIYLRAIFKAKKEPVIKGYIKYW